MGGPTSGQTPKCYANLIPIRNKADRDRIAPKVRTEAQRRNYSITRRINELKKKGITDEKARELFLIMTDAGVSSLDHRIVIEKLKSIALNSNDPKALDILSKNIALWHKLRHGENINIKSENVNIDMSLSMTPEFEQELRDHFGREE